MTCPHIVNLEKILVSIETFLQRELKITRICTFLQGHMVCLVLYHVGHMQYLMVFPSCRSAPENIFGAAMEFAGHDAAKTGEPQPKEIGRWPSFISRALLTGSACRSLAVVQGAPLMGLLVRISSPLRLLEELAATLHPA